MLSLWALILLGKYPIYKKADYVGQSIIYKPLRSHYVDLDGKNGFDMYCYNLSAVIGFEEVAAIPQYLAPGEEVIDDSDDGCRGCCLGCLGFCCCKK